ncbi:voltage-dependent potassium channel protein [Capsaspora owczarzaki ATCC 30864]|uniref:voltage-dependent potassium channel protein n=1 Tax=Capsaspora owczarzaki (strain ATCC 30864) TaxID=595528 RepID=UPI0001FE4AC0|nr:voltage-dependent potassium channel protein [Capsaspora owczarzaki ATCC 30864]|eukprot:XP_004346938.1 voltage-dependent potassium channel protein [Capsaspora owczarzaki ATCC 30864]
MSHVVEFARQPSSQSLKSALAAGATDGRISPRRSPSPRLPDEASPSVFHDDPAAVPATDLRVPGATGASTTAAASTAASTASSHTATSAQTTPLLQALLEAQKCVEARLKLAEQATEAKQVLDSTQDAAELLAGKQVHTLKQRVFQWLSDPNSSKSAYLWSIFMMLLIVLSTFTFCLGTVEAFNLTSAQRDAWFGLETFVIVGFCIDYFARLATAPNRLAFAIQPMNVIDILAILPYFVDLILEAALGSGQIGIITIIRILRLIRVLRLFKMSNKLEKLRLMGIALKRSKEGVVMLLLLVLMALVVFSSCIFYAETSVCTEDDASNLYVCDFNGNQYETPFQNIPASFWWCITTLTTVGYGDAYPVTPGGKLVGALTMLCGLLVIAFPITIISANLGEVYDEYKLAKQLWDSRDNKLRAGLYALEDAPVQALGLINRPTKLLASPLPQDYPDTVRLVVQLTVATAQRIQAIREEMNELENTLEGFSGIIDSILVTYPELAKQFSAQNIPDVKSSKL